MVARLMRVLSAGRSPGLRRRNDGARQAFAFSRRVFARVMHRHCPSETRGRRECRVMASPMARLQQRKQAAVTTGSARSTGGFKRSSQHSGFGGCDDHSKEEIDTAATAIAGAAPRCGACSTGKILAGDCRGGEQRGCCARGRSVTRCRTQIVPKSRRHATLDFQIFGKAALWAVPLVGGARGDRASQCAGAFSTGDWAAPWTGCLDNLP